MDKRRPRPPADSTPPVVAPDRRAVLAGLAGVLGLGGLGGLGGLAGLAGCQSAAPGLAAAPGPLVRGVAVREVARRIVGQPTTDGAGVRLLRVIGSRALPDLDPFVLLDRIHSDEPGAYIRGFPDHPHRGFETVTVMLAGQMRHHDSKGGGGLIRGGGAQWMTAGRGIVHSEMPEQTAGLLSGFQFWINLPAREKMRAQEYQDIPVERIPQVALGAGGVAAIIGGRALDAQGPIAARTTDPMLLTLALEDDRPVEIQTPRSHAAFVFVHTGEALLHAGPRDERIPAGQLAVLGPGDVIRLRADTQRTGILLAAAKPIGEPIARRGPFVMNTEAELDQAFAEYRAGTLAL